MRERTTWNRSEIRTAAMPKQADPYLMNQDHVSKNPRADKYMNGTPSSWAEDVHSPNEWEKEYSGGATKRNEIGAPEFRPETFSHSEHSKSASQAILVKKADLCVKVARMLFRKADETKIEDQAVALMSLPDSELIDTFQRLAQDQEGQEAPKDQQQQAAQQEQTQESQQSSQQTQQAAQQGEEQQAPAQQGMQQQSAGYQTAMQQCMQALQQGDQQGVQAAIQQMVQEQMKPQASQADFPGGEWGKNNPVASTRKRAQDDQGQGQQAPAQQQQQSSMNQQAMIEAAVAGLVAQQQGQGQQAQEPADEGMQQQASDDQLLDDMLAPATAHDMGGLGDFEMEAPVMDTGDIQLGPEDQVLQTLFASQETEDAQKAQEQGSQHQAAVRTASTRTVGTRPTAGVARVGGASAAAPASKTASSDVDKLSNLWSSAPDVREAFGLR